MDSKGPVSAVMRAVPKYAAALMVAALLAAACQNRRGMWVNRVGSLLSVFFTDEPVRDYDSAASSNTDIYASYFNHMLENGIYVAPSQFESMFVSAAHSEEDVERTADCIRGFPMA